MKNNFKKIKKSEVILGSIRLAFFLFIFLLILILDLKSFYHEKYIKNNWIKYEAEVTSFSNSELSIINYTYTINQNTYLGQDKSEFHDKGEIITIYINPKNEAKSEIYFHAVNPLGVILEILFGVCSIHGVFVLIFAIKNKNSKYPIENRVNIPTS